MWLKSASRGSSPLQVRSWLGCLCFHFPSRLSALKVRATVAWFFNRIVLSCFGAKTYTGEVISLHGRSGRPCRLLRTFVVSVWSRSSSHRRHLRRIDSDLWCQQICSSFVRNQGRVQAKAWPGIQFIPKHANYRFLTFTNNDVIFSSISLQLVQMHRWLPAIVSASCSAGVRLTSAQDIPRSLVITHPMTALCARFI